MANEITARWHDTGVTLYAQVLDATGQIYNGSTFEVPVDANWGTYDIALTEAGTTRIYRASFPAVAAGVYSLLIYLQAGGSPAVADTLIGLGDMAWSGTAAVLGASGDAVLAAIGALSLLDATGAQAAAAAALAAYDAATAADVWSYGSRTLTQAVVVGPGGAINGSAITLHRGDSFSASLTGLGDITGRSKLWFTVKRRTTLPDADAMIQIVETTGVVTVAGAAPASADNGALTVTNAAAGNVTITLDEVETAKLTVETGWPWDIQMRSAGGEVTTLAVGTMAVTADVTRATS